MKNYEEIIEQLKLEANPENVKGMARFGISQTNTLGISMVTIRKFAKTIGKSHELAVQLWESGYHEARILAALIEDPKMITYEQAQKWISEFDSWDVCDQCCMNLLDKTLFRDKLIKANINSEHEFIKRSSLAIISALGVGGRKTPDDILAGYLELLIEPATDERNFVKKAVSWALRQIGKKNQFLNQKAKDTAIKILDVYPDSKSARWIAKDVLRELENEKVFLRLSKKSKAL